MPVLELHHIDKAFPGAVALTDVSLTIEPGRVHALVGENGAGKSTLIKIASGVLQPDSGRILLDGDEVRLSPGSARDLGIRVVHQERQVALPRSVADNVVLDRPPRGRTGLVTRASVAREAATRLERVGIDLDLDAPAWSLSVAQIQLLEIARAVDFGARCIIMDEPTATLHREEISGLFEVIRAIRDRGIAVIYISHHLDEVMELADDYTVLRDGQHINSGQIEGTTIEELVSLMFGQDVSLRREDVHSGTSSPGDPVVELTDVHFGNVLRGLTLQACRGEILVITGAVGSGTRELAQVMGGALKPTQGTASLTSNTSSSRRKAAKNGVAYLPADRKRQGLLLDRSVTENTLLAKNALDRSPWYLPTSAFRQAFEACQRLAVKVGNLGAPIRGLSGGNQQKVILARWVEVHSDVLVLDEPTAGIDIPSKFEIYRRLRSMAESGACVVVFSTDYPEIRCIADRVIVIRDGRIAGEIPGEDASEHRIFELEMGR